MQQFALGWIVVQLAVQDGTPNLASLYLGFVGLSRGIPGLLFGLFGGVLADRMDRRRLLISTRGVGAVVSVTLAALTLTGAVNLYWIMGLSVVSSITFAIDGPARQAILPGLVPAKDLLSAVGLSQATSNTSMILGPLLGGVLVIPLGVGGILALNSVAYVLAALALLGMTRSVASERVQHTSVLRSLADGLAFVLRDPVLKSVIGLSIALSLFARPLQAQLPAVAHETLGLGAVGLSWLLAAASVGTLLGSLGAASTGGFQRRGMLLIMAVAFAGAAEVAFTLQRALPPALFFVVLPGIGHYGFSGTAFGIMQTQAPDRLRGRVISIYTTTIGGFSPLGSLMVGSIGAVVGINTALAAGGVLCLLAAMVVLLRVAPLRELGKTAA